MVVFPKSVYDLGQLMITKCMVEPCIFLIRFNFDGEFKFLSLGER
jgi:hypothetical protein